MDQLVTRRAWPVSFDDVSTLRSALHASGSQGKVLSRQGWLSVEGQKSDSPPDLEHFVRLPIQTRPLPDPKRELRKDRVAVSRPRGI